LEVIVGQEATQQATLELLNGLKHDLGKYVAFQIRWLDAESPREQRLEALRSDLLATQRGPEGTRDANTIWRGFRAVLVGELPTVAGERLDCFGKPWFLELDGAMKRVEKWIQRLESGTLRDDEVDQAIRDAMAASEACRSAFRQVRG